ncbi:MAG: Isoleucine-tRNA ligase [Parcubacteria group bacterium GW2011_GWD2_35_7]|uniref:isoleucine--tRNA ligase n=1 Tax=Candidatus Nomurabacteria bacterium GW2011_GWA1_36_15 TaxID=1618728 RepID=A0A0G0DUT0_9BACT|nr:MAG: Isoleucine-tRNA ligase [Parcubacteria group bacterium GW2011_GWD2_35_7]KKP98299.1 MAG: Isoleucine-tRNA ligase [Candidatus Nomurabacteria bacterium GW2011_GWA1_36_15]HCY18087.1 isoleucine--tRNA ligase [Candidatus Nomurabacteria bacterium]
MAENETNPSISLGTKKSETALREERVLEFWKTNDIFKKSLEKFSPKGNYVFYDGPPFATGLPHYGHILGSVTKDVIGRYQAMRGFSVPRRWGWDCHGLPIENIVEKDLNISGKKAIEELGIDKFVEYARSKVLTYVAEWEKTVNRIGRWVDFDNSYKTMDNTFVESVWWALGELNKKGLLYESVRVLAYCPRCETPIANSEIAMDNSYKDITDISVYVKSKLKSGQKFGQGKETKDSVYMITWTTTPWTLPGNTAVAVGKNINYTALRIKGVPELLIVASESVGRVFKGKEIEIVYDDIKGSDLIGLSYEPIFDYYKNIDTLNKENIWKVWHADFVTTDVGTGVVHEAPAFGEDDMSLAKEHNIPFIRHVEPNGTFSKEVTDFAGIKVKPKEDHQSADVLIIKYLAQNGKLFEKEKIVHSYPHCYRCETPLLYYALPSWFVNIQKVKNNLLKNAKSMNWVPSHLKGGRFKNTMESAPDWTISRNRYWASPLPFWKSSSGKIMFVNSIEDLKSKTKKSGNKYFVMRHGEAENNVLKVCSSAPDNIHHLTEKGKKQVTEAVKSLVDKNIDMIFASSFLRTEETTNIIKKVINFPSQNIKIDSRLVELNDGIFADGPIQKVHDFFKNNNLSKYDGAPEGGESLVDVKKRVGEFIYEIDRKYQNKNILIITHEDTVWALFSAINGLNKEETMDDIKNNFLLKNAEIKEFNFIPLPHNDNYELDLHRPYIDNIVLVDEKREEYKRIPEVIDCWFESGSMPFAQDHYPFENLDWKKKNFPAGFVAEYIAQTRTWFYYTHVISSILFRKAPFENVVTTGTILAEDGEKMSKSRNNFPDPWILFNKYGVDALRFYLMSCPVMKGEDINFSEKSVQDISNKIISRLNNVLAFYELYRDPQLKILEHKKSENILDQWILTRLDELICGMTNGMEKYDISLATRPVESFIEDLSTWYLRRSRDRIKNGDEKAKQTLYFVLKNLAKLMAPFAPFAAEDIWLKLKNENDVESVHLESWPSKTFKFFSFGKSKILENMEVVRKVVTLGLEARQKAGIKVRQPLAKLEIKNYKLDNEYETLIKDELNVKKIIFEKRSELKSSERSDLGEVLLDTKITPELKLEGNYRELVRAVQDMRKKIGLTPNDVISLVIETNDIGKKLIQKFEVELLKIVLASKIEFKENDGEETKIDELVFKIRIKK